MLRVDILIVHMYLMRAVTICSIMVAKVETMAEFYRDLRQRSQQNNGATLPVTTRLLEACIRLATAHAKLKLHTEVRSNEEAREPTFRRFSG